jgi:P27 family predicted phage terminase small subunit
MAQRIDGGEEVNDAPEHLDAQANAKWDQLVLSLRERGQIDAGTLDALSCYCSAWSRWIAAEGQVNALGTVVKSPAGFPVPNPYVAIAAAAQRQMRQWAAELKLTPRARGKKVEGEPSAVSRILAEMEREGQKR